MPASEHVNTLERVQELPDSEIGAVAQELFGILYQEVSYEEVSANFTGQPEVEELLALEEDTLRRNLPAETSVELGRLLIEQYAADPALETFVQRAIDKVECSDDLIVGEILAAGLVVNLILLVATTKFEIRKKDDGGVTWRLSKGRASPELVKTVIDPFAGVIKGLPD